MKYEPYCLEQNTCTRAGLPLEQAVESLRFFVLNAEQDPAIDIAYDMYRTSPHTLRRLWKELFRLAAVDIGMADPYAPDYVYHLYEICYDCEPYTPESGGMMALCFIHAIRYLCVCGQDPCAVRALTEVKQAYAAGETAKIPDFAYDHHNHAGRQLGHNPLDFLDPDGGSLVIEEVPDVAEPYRARLKELLRPKYGGDAPQPFTVGGYNHYYDLTSRNGLNLELMQSAFQKSIRRALEREALMICYEAATSGWEMEYYLWERMVIMSVEDVGVGDRHCNRLMYTYFRLKDLFMDEPETRLAMLFQAVLYLCRCKKERSTELIKGILVQEFAQGKTPRLAPGVQKE